ncbi:tryptophan synthase subunit alpha [Pelistega europaea]|uniref:Tryptophan synthase alpha chain n=1 Tax=Pelistega europaea TaxID=106147 RepID=A0A7Y4LCV4_9BURK|nr:tryptophan synthase subunit alpha [Pelistega europaea]NOL50181.1 tryptophan synthase subunit alpha [Pelistega europaea]
MASVRIQQTFAKVASRAALIPYICAGDPNAETTLAVMHTLVANGADIIELGMPFSDPMADGPVIQHASERALAAGMTLHGVLAIVREFRQTNQDTPVVLMGYANPIEAMGREAFAQAAADSGVDGALIVDYPPEEYDDFGDMLTSRGIDPIFLLAPTSTEDRMQQVARVASGYLYYVSLRGVTGASASLDIDDVKRQLAVMKKYIQIPICVGFGISDAQSAQRIGAVAEGVVIGSKLVDTMHKALDGEAAQGIANKVVNAAGEWIKGIAKALK